MSAIRYVISRTSAVALLGRGGYAIPSLRSQAGLATWIRQSSTATSSTPTDASSRMAQLLRTKFNTDNVVVEDVSGGCGAFYKITVVSPAFEGLSTIKQHRAVNEILEAEIGKMHGLTLQTMTPAQFAAKKQGSK